MDRSLYKTITTQRGLKYAYTSIPAEGTPKDTLLFVHGFPSSSYDWRNQVDFFRKAGFSLIIPDLLGAGDTEKPADWTLFQFRAMAGDVIDILNAEKVEKVIVIGHDWYVSPNHSGFYQYTDLWWRLWNVGAAFLHRVSRVTIQSASKHMPLLQWGIRRHRPASIMKRH